MDVIKNYLDELTLLSQKYHIQINGGVLFLATVEDLNYRYEIDEDSNLVRV